MSNYKIKRRVTWYDVVLNDEVVYTGLSLADAYAYIAATENGIELIGF